MAGKLNHIVRNADCEFAIGLPLLFFRKTARRQKELIIVPKTEFQKIKSDYDGLELSLMLVRPDGEVRALVQLAHGMCEHKKRYLPFMEFLAEQGCLCVINDHRGHGESIRNRNDLGYFYKNGDVALVEDLHQISTWLRAQEPGKKLFLFGHSMGSLAVRVYTEKYDAEIDSLVVCGSPGENPAAGLGLLLMKLMAIFRGERYRSQMMRQLITGSFAKRFPEEGSEGWLSAQGDNVKKYQKDPLCGFTFTLNGYTALLRLMQRTYGRRNSCRNEKLPVHFYSGANDPCMPDHKGFVHAMECMKKAGYTDVSGQLFEGLRHEILNEANSEEIYLRIWNESFAPYI